MIPGLLITEGSKRGEYVQFQEGVPFWVGRKEKDTNLILAKDPKISSKHGFFISKSGQLVFQDESSNGTRLNGRIIKNALALLKNADILCIGSTHFQVVDLDQSQPSQVEFDFDACLEDIKKRKEDKNSPEILERLGQYRNIEVIGSGTCGRVYKSLDIKNRRMVALKVLSKIKGLSPEFMSRFVREAELLNKMDHSFIIKLYEANQVDYHGETYNYIALEYFQGVDLSFHIRSHGPLIWSEAFLILYQLADALNYMHLKGILHRDMKPSNVMYNSVTKMAKIIDLGLGKSLYDEDRETLFVTAPNSSLGLPNYIPIEQWESAKDVDERADIYSLGVVIYFVLTGKLPYGKYQNIVKLYDAIVEQKLTPLQEICSTTVPKELLVILEKMISFEAIYRYPCFAQILSELEVLALQYKIPL